MFQIYREPSFNRRYRVVYFTELDDHNKESEINDAMRGEHIFDGYLRNYTKEEAKRVVWPTRKEALQTTGVVFAFVFVMAVFLWMVDAGLLWAVRLLMGRSDS